MIEWLPYKGFDLDGANKKNTVDPSIQEHFLNLKMTEHFEELNFSLSCSNMLYYNVEHDIEVNLKEFLSVTETNKRNQIMELFCELEDELNNRDNSQKLNDKSSFKGHEIAQHDLQMFKFCSLLLKCNLLSKSNIDDNKIVNYALTILENKYSKTVAIRVEDSECKEDTNQIDENLEVDLVSERRLFMNYQIHDNQYKNINQIPGDTDRGDIQSKELNKFQNKSTFILPILKLISDYFDVSEIA